MEILQSNPMIPQYRSNRPVRAILLIVLFLATLLSKCLATTTSDGMLYSGLLDMDNIIDSLLDGHNSHLEVRQSNISVTLADNAVVGMDINPASATYWTFPGTLLNSTNSTTGNGTALYITVSTCTQPAPKAGLNATQVYANSTLPVLQLYVSTDSSNTLPGPGSNATLQTVRNLSNGFGNVTLEGVSSDVYISVVSQNITSDWQGSWSYQLGTSTKRIEIMYSTNSRTTTKRYSR
jgi:hypothetical protein